MVANNAVLCVCVCVSVRAYTMRAHVRAHAEFGRNTEKRLQLQYFEFGSISRNNDMIIIVLRQEIELYSEL